MNFEITIPETKKKTESIQLSDDRLPANVVAVVKGSRKYNSDEEPKQGLWLVLQVCDGDTVLHFNTKFCTGVLSPKSNLYEVMKALTGVDGDVISEVRLRFCDEQGALDPHKLLGLPCTANLAKTDKGYYNLASISPLHPKVGTCAVKAVDVPKWVVKPFDWEVEEVVMLDDLKVRASHEKEDMPY